MPFSIYVRITNKSSIWMFKFDIHVFFFNLPVNSKENQNIPTGEIVKGLILKYIMTF